MNENLDYVLASFNFKFRINSFIALNIYSQVSQFSPAVQNISLFPKDLEHYRADIWFFSQHPESVTLLNILGLGLRILRHEEP
jgi:hypothetical protein